MSNLAEICLKEAGITNRPVVFRKVPSTTFAVTFDSVDNINSSDLENDVRTHSITVELYEHSPDATSRPAFESAMDSRGIKWERSDTTWLVDEQLYETIYTFDYYEKRRT